MSEGVRPRGSGDDQRRDEGKMREKEERATGSMKVKAITRC